MAKTICVKLSSQGIDQAVRELRQYRTDLEAKCAEFVCRVAETGQSVASAKFKAAVYAGVNDVTVGVDQTGSVAVLYASGEAVGFLEFGTGAYNPAYPADAGYTPPARGSYGKGHGKNKAWGFYGEPGNEGKALGEIEGKGTLVVTHGNPPTLGMYGAQTEMAARLTEIAREVFAT